MNITVFAHIHNDAEVTVELQNGVSGRYAVIESGNLSVFVNSREKLLELASALGQAAQKWEEEQ